ncbi:MAG: ShlB/FhaC/HecB family hemolysin secretion/activation protein [Betaproteobacteria bacterium]|nr:ShlB/FhaC/HecB family hemolysin secretion/activation protein [Betaproteobacteria bacterium]
MVSLMRRQAVKNPAQPRQNKPRWMILFYLINIGNHLIAVIFTIIMRNACILFSLPALFLTVSLAQAQIPRAAQPGQIERQFQEAPKARSQSAPLSAPLKPQPVPAGADQVRFQVDKIEVEGVTVYPVASMQDDLAPLLKREISLADLYRLADQLTARYRNDGYLLSQVIVPEQKVEGGIAKLRAVEGFIANIKLVGVENDRRGLVAAYAEPIRAARPLTGEVLERQMLLINDLPGAFARAVLSPSPDTFGAADLTIQFSQRQISGGVSANNQGGKALGPMRYLADVETFNLFGLQDHTQLRYAFAPAGELSYYSLLHEQPVGSSGGKLSFLASHARSEPEELYIIPVDNKTWSDSMSLTYSHPLIRTRAGNLQARATLSAHDGDTSSIFGFYKTKDRLRVLRFGLSYDKADIWNGINLLDVEFSQGLKGLGASDNGYVSDNGSSITTLSRPAGKVDFQKINLYLSRIQTLSPNWSALAALSGQYAYDNLLSSELFSYGGEPFGRGYDPSEMVGDPGAALKLELRYADSLDLGMPLPYTLYGFYDVGKVWQRSVAGFSSSDSAASAGLGLRFAVGQYYSGFLEVANPIDHDVFAEGDRNARFFMGLSARF